MGSTTQQCWFFLLSHDFFVLMFVFSGEKPLNLTSSDLTAVEILDEINWDMIDE